VSDLLMRSPTAGPDGIRELGSILLCWLDATDIRRI